MAELNLAATKEEDVRGGGGGLSARERARAAQAGGDKKPPGRPSGSTNAATRDRERAATKDRERAEESAIRSRLQQFFDRLAESRESRGDDELATVIREDTDIMAKAILSATAHVPPLRKGLFLFLAVAEPVFAFGRIGRILFGRWNDRRARQQAEYEQSQAGVQTVPA